MYKFERRVPLDFTPYPEPPMDDRTGPPLSQGVILTLINTVAVEYCTPEMRKALNDVDPNTWYHGQVLESILNEFEDQDPTLPQEVGKNIYYTLRSQFISLGMQTPSDVITTIPLVWNLVTRGDSGEWRTKMLGPGKAHVELEQPYNCMFEHGGLLGALECFDATDVQLEHVKCMRRGDPYCVFEVTWDA
ncbi:MAG: hypothetical protein GFH27_549279n3 [Chloroflexi bacterium AL-W]|nr:hypothetical protein [Chloroflexi bacterium AL-N1]NOK71012.1 hypothetical protein [Chloroflexi bacterium AL-N10]NOK72765.1 hypothetical protein [Chloroflexi bacterium AL-N5]NOK79148.1 hypothetical protein [Chloroflexi bacterium AL-W]NOK87062.1 hypothetical protein [Chloroflexi bacterium AL-N15]